MRGQAMGMTAALAVLAAGMAADAAPACAPAGSEKAVEAGVRAWFDAGRRDDLAALATIQVPEFYAYDNGKRFEGMTLGELVKQAHAQGAQIEWNLHDIDVHLGCDQAWAAWVNTGAVGSRGAMAPVTWLESAVFTWRDGVWRMAFLHSARVQPEAGAPSAGPSLGGRRRR